MRILKFLSITPLINSIRTPLLESRKICKDCKFFIANKKECSLFGDTDLVNGKVSYECAISVRNNKDKCGENAKYFEENEYKVLTVPYYFMVDYWWVFYSFGLYFYLMFRTTH
jgi:hypothetical protein